VGTPEAKVNALTLVQKVFALQIVMKNEYDGRLINEYRVCCNKKRV